MLGITLLGFTGVSCATHRNTVLIKGKELLHEHQAETSTSKAPDAATQAKIQVTYAKLPLHFEPNQGQTDEQVHFLSRGSGYNLFLGACRENRGEGARQGYTNC